MSQEINWKRDLWDGVSDRVMREKIQSLPSETQRKILESFSGTELLGIGWEEVCLGCHQSIKERGDCGCPAGTGFCPPKRKEDVSER